MQHGPAQHNQRKELILNDLFFEVMSKAIILFTAIPVHECAHAWAAEKLGDPTGRNEGRITLNPFAHLDLWGSIMMLVMGFGWGKPVRTNPANYKNPKIGMMLSALAGPASNFIMAFLSMIVCRVFIVIYYANMNETMYFTADVFLTISLINLALGIFNFLPIPPLDGSKIFNAVLPERLYFKIMSYEQYIFIVLFIIIRIGLLDKPLEFLNMTGTNIMIFLTDWVEKIMVGILI